MFVWQEVLLLHLEVMRLCYGTGRVHLFRLGRHRKEQDRREPANREKKEMG